MSSLDENYDHHARPSTDDQEQCLISQLYRTSARVYLLQATRQRCKQVAAAKHTLDSAYLASQATYQISQLCEGSVFGNALPWPISIVSRELTNDHIAEREYILHRLQTLEKRFHMKILRGCKRFLSLSGLEEMKSALMRKKELKTTYFWLGNPCFTKIPCLSIQVLEALFHTSP